VLGFLLIDKPAGPTSHDVVAAMRRRFSERRIGHAGTLDPLATGLLVLAIGPATRLLPHLCLEPKEYLAAVTFGARSETLDAEGEIMAGGALPLNLADSIERALPRFLGRIDQRPPAHSAVKLRGKPLYAYARSGESVPAPTRTVQIEQIELLHVEPPRAELRVVCSGGTYIRSLASDLGEAVGCGAYLAALRRIRAGKFSVEEAVSMESAGPQDVLSPLEGLRGMPQVRISGTVAEDVRHGRSIPREGAGPGGPTALTDSQGSLIAIARPEGNQWRPMRVIPRNGDD
jgi:tRNA pseudouridine55 synthase